MVRSVVARDVNPGSEPVVDESAAAVPADRFLAVDVELERTERKVDAALSQIRIHRRLARLIVTRDLGFEPSAEVLHGIVRIATHEGLRPELLAIARRFVALSALGDQVAGQVLDSAVITPEGLIDGGILACEVLEAGRAAENSLLTEIGTASESEREFLLEIASCLPSERDDLLTAALVAPRLEQMIDEAHADPRATPGCRTRANALALSAVLTEDLLELDPPEGLAKPSPAQTERAIEQARTDLTAYRVIADRLHRRQETALEAGLSGFAEELRRARCDLYATYLSLCSALDAAIVNQTAGSGD